MTDKHPCHTPTPDDEPPEMVKLSDIVSDDDSVDPGGVNFRYSRRDDRDDEEETKTDGGNWECNICGENDFDSREDFADHWRENHE